MHKIEGTVALPGTDSETDGTDACHGRGGFDDITAGADVTIRDGNNRIIATTTLFPGVLDADQEGCTFRFEADVHDTPFYQFQVTHRSAPSYSRRQLAANGWDVAFTLDG